MCFFSRASLRNCPGQYKTWLYVAEQMPTSDAAFWGGYSDAPYEGGVEEGGTRDFEDILELAKWHAEQRLSSLVIEMALLAIFQIVQALMLVEVNGSFLYKESVIPIGFGPGLIAAAVIAAAGSISEITIPGLEGIKVQAYIGQCSLKEDILICGTPSTLIKFSMTTTMTTTAGFKEAALIFTLPDSLGLWSVGPAGFATPLRHELEQRGHTVRLGPCLPLQRPLTDANKNDVVSVSRHEIAVVSMAGRFPESDTLDEFWHLRVSGQTTHRESPLSRFGVQDLYDPTRTHDALLARHGCFIKKPGLFDHRLFNISPRETLQMDPVQRMLLMTTHEAFEMAGYLPPLVVATLDRENHPGLPRISAKRSTTGNPSSTCRASTPIIYRP
ncbi:hypothetical protein E4U55_000998 [Claviceps digitariae]|nr:hypothetical protein E4U55_000998 [Claviceps digitariae]